MDRRQVLIAAFASLSLPFPFGERASFRGVELDQINNRGTNVQTLFQKDLAESWKSENTASIAVLRVDICSRRQEQAAYASHSRFRLCTPRNDRVAGRGWADTKIQRRRVFF
jgi:hypothetical protein